ncbi:hypothetical protein SmJEL517_g06162 [Synchytrium microbalum]|uniref:Reelin domain-containing protein n=1 Tax=Synchytrium microbalum TaxID=1806994 RepID=A0A507BS62_9FUNG|nr:uncharacterized protein SmJEL517_g06162 [Synchytrium microbalum]TPX30221.1 hypothetical protein SmJEL517_g06162 [Synchytrium microbalum]
MTLKIAAALVVCLFGGTLGLPGGAPFCDQTTQTLGFLNKHGKDSTAKYTITSRWVSNDSDRTCHQDTYKTQSYKSAQTFTAGQAMKLTLSGTSNIGGLIFGGQDANKRFVGGVTAPTTGSFKVCNAGVGGGFSITHSSLNALTTLDIPFTPPAGTIGPLTVVSLATVGSIGTPWGTAMLTLQAGGGGGGAGGGGNTTAPSPAGNQAQPSAAPAAQSKAPVVVSVAPIAPAAQSAAPAPLQTDTGGKVGDTKPPPVAPALYSPKPDPVGFVKLQETGGVNKLAATPSPKPQQTLKAKNKNKANKKKKHTPNNTAAAPKATATGK